MLSKDNIYLLIRSFLATIWSALRLETKVNISQIARPSSKVQGRHKMLKELTHKVFSHFIRNSLTILAKVLNERDLTIVTHGRYHAAFQVRQLKLSNVTDH